MRKDKAYSVTGGRYDGILGVQAALEVLRTLEENNIKTYAPIALIDWTNEEGARFPGAMMCSGVWSTKSATSLEACWAVKDIDGIHMKKALEEIGYLGDIPCDYRHNGLESYFELHIEQGPKLEASGNRVGVVTAVQGMKWYSVRVSGVEGHSGTTPMAGRSDALVTAARLITAVSDTASSTGLGVATVGVISNDTQSQATIPSGVEFIIDVRCSTDKMVDELCMAIFKRFDEIVHMENNSTKYHIVRTWGLPESIFHEDCIEAVRAAAIEEVGSTKIMELKSGAGHDAAWTSKVVKSSMIFVPSKDGVSHNPAEYTSPEDCALGAQILLQTVLRYDESIRNRS
jgi:hydantoinase/carbamoylase family amidase